MRQSRAWLICAGMALGAGVWAACGDEAPIPVASVQITPALDTVRAGETIQLTAVARDVEGNVLTGRTVAWATGHSGIATVDTAGLVTGTGNGEVLITATSEGQSDTAVVRAWVGVTGMWTGTIDPATVNCQIVMSITESVTGAITGASRLHAPCAEVIFTVTGTNNTGGVADSVSTVHTENLGTLEYRGTFDGEDTITGGFWEAGWGPIATIMTRQDLLPGPFAPARVESTSPTETSALLRRGPGRE
jgi:hypothetical protein